MVSVGSEPNAYEKNNGIDDTRNGRRARERTKETKVILNPRSNKTDIR